VDCRQFGWRRAINIYLPHAIFKSPGPFLRRLKRIDK